MKVITSSGVVSLLLILDGALGAALFLLCCTSMQAQSPSSGYIVDSLETKVEIVKKNPPEAYRAEVIRRRQDRRELQRRGYANILYDVTSMDGFAAAIAFLKMQLQIDLSLPHTMLFWIVPPEPLSKTPGIPFEEDWSYPDDPWNKESF